MQITAKKIIECTSVELHQIYALRSQVFVVEQNCAYQDVDEKDLQAIHVCVKEQDNLVAYCRILPPGVAYSDTAIGRVLVAQNQRHKGFAKLLMQWSINYSFKHFEHHHILISAQTYLVNFYEGLGFVIEGEGYLEDNIPHQKMRLKRPIV